MIPTFPTIRVALLPREDDAVKQLNDLIRRCSEPSFDRWAYLVSLEVEDRILSRPVVESMMEFLNLPLAKDPSGTCEEECRWIRVLMERSSICEKYYTPGWSEENPCTYEEKKRLLSVNVTANFGSIDQPLLLCSFYHVVH